MWRTRLRVQQRGGESDSHCIVGEEINIGRSRAHCQLILRDANVARRHCRLAYDDQGRLSIIDLNSSNGIVLNGRKIAQEPFVMGDQLYVGDFLITLEEEPQRLETP